MSDLPKYERISNMEHDDVELSSHIQGAGGGRMGCAPSTSMLTPRQAVTSYSVCRCSLYENQSFEMSSSW